ncbi:hypothetical protein Tco_0105605 [Tanacetum coccineum]
MYLTFILDMAMLFCFFDDQLTNLSPNSCILPDVLSLEVANVLGIAPVAIIDRQLPFEYTIASRSTDVMVPISPALASDFAANVLAKWNAVFDAHSEVACLMLGSITPELHRQFENYSPYEMLQELKSMFEKQAGVERFDLIQTFHAYKQEEGKPVGPYVIKMKNYVAQLEHLSYVLPRDLSVGLIMNGLTRDFAGFIRNYNKHHMGKMIGELHALLIEYEKDRKMLKARVKEKARERIKVVSLSLKTLDLLLKEHPAKDDTCHHYKEVGYCKRNYPAYLAELIKKKKQVGTASSSDIFVIELFSFPTKSWVYGDVGRCEAGYPYKPLQQRSVKCIFIGYPKEIMGYYFPPENKIIVARYAEFLEKIFCLKKSVGGPKNLKKFKIKIHHLKNTSEIPMEVEGFEPPQDEVVPVRRSTMIHRAPDRLCLKVEVEEH